MRIWIDLANSPHVPFFHALIPRFAQRGAQVELTARDYAQTVELSKAAGLTPAVIGGHGGGKLAGKAGNLVGRAAALARWARGRGFDLAVSHNSYAQIAAASGLGIRTVTLMDYEHQPANHLAFRLASRVIVPRAFPSAELKKYGASTRKVRRYEGTKEDVYLAGFVADVEFAETLRGLGIASEDVLVVARPPAREALYHRFENELFDELLVSLSARAEVKIILLPRSDAQRAEYETRKPANLIMPRAALDGKDDAANAALAILLGQALALGIDRLGDLLGDQTARVPGEIAEQERRKQRKHRQIDERQLECGRAEQLAQRRHALRPDAPEP